MQLDPGLYDLHASVCKTLASSTRLRIIEALGHSAMPAGEIARALGIQKANVSQHLAVMRSMGIVRARREGLHVFYRLTSPKIIQACQLMREVLLEQLAERRDILETQKGPR